uniref:Uncharacterized protein n=1 Tax=Aegilops tauschii subsp. strangulata TaxID=200361 RepID=A0A453I0T8_AEGTS
MSGTAVPGSATSQGSRHQSGGSRWDIPQAGGSRGMRSHPHEVLRYCPSSSTWKRDSSTIQMGSTNNLRGIKGKNLGSMDLDINVVKGGSAMAFGQEEGGNYDRWPLRSPSLVVRIGTVSSRQEASSPAAIDRLHHMDLDVGKGTKRLSGMI